MAIREGEKKLKVLNAERERDKYLIGKVVHALAYDIMSAEYTVVDDEGNLTILPERFVEEV